VTSFVKVDNVVLSADRWAMEAWRCDGPFDRGNLHLAMSTWDHVNARFLSRQLSALRGSEAGCHLVKLYACLLSSVVWKCVKRTLDLWHVCCVVSLRTVFVVGSGLACFVDVLQFLVGKPQRKTLL
jgi:hypothetical protein